MEFSMLTLMEYSIQWKFPCKYCSMAHGISHTIFQWNFQCHWNVHASISLCLYEITHNSHNTHIVLTQYSHSTNSVLTQYSHSTHIVIVTLSVSFRYGKHQGGGGGGEGVQSMHRPDYCDSSCLVWPQYSYRRHFLRHYTCQMVRWCWQVWMLIMITWNNVVTVYSRK